MHLGLKAFRDQSATHCVDLPPGKGACSALFGSVHSQDPLPSEFEGEQGGTRDVAQLVERPACVNPQICSPLQIKLGVLV